MLMLTSAGYKAFIPPSGPGEFRNINGWVGREYVRPLEGPTNPFTAEKSSPIGTSSKPTVTITCTILLFDAEAPDPWPPGVWNAFRSYIRTNIEAIWNSASNPLITPDYNVICNITVVDTPFNQGRLEDGELFISVKRGEVRSFIDRDGWAGVFFVNDQMNVLLQQTPLPVDRITANVPAHEFGHVLGL